MIDRQQRQAWAAGRAHAGLADDDLDPAKHPVFARITDLSVAIMLLPADPLAPVLDFTDAWPLIPHYLAGRLADGVGDLQHEEVTGSHVFRSSRSAADETVMAVGLARHGGVFAGVGHPGRYRMDNGRPVVRLSSIVGAVRVALTTQVNALAPTGERSVAPAGPWELTIAVPGARGAVLGAYASPQWGKVEDNEAPPTCTMEHPLVRLEIPEFPDEAGLPALLAHAMSRAVNIFGTTTEFYANPRINLRDVAANF